MLAVLLVCFTGELWARRALEPVPLSPKTENLRRSLLFALSPARVSPRTFVSSTKNGRDEKRETGAISAMEQPIQDEASQFSKMVAQNRMITIEESNIRYAGACLVALLALYDYIGMQATGNFDYNKIAAGVAGAYLLFETGRKSI